MNQDKTITKTEAIHQIAKQMKDLMNVDEFVERVLEIWPSSAKNPQVSVRQTIRDQHIGRDLLFMDEKTLIPMQMAMIEVRFRIPLARQEINRGWLYAYPAFQYMNKPDLAYEDFHFEDDKGRAIPVNPVGVKASAKTNFGTYEFERIVFDLKWWYEKHKLQRGDSLLVTILNWERGHFRLIPEPARIRPQHEAEIQHQNQAIADYIFRELEEARYESVWGRVAIPTAYLRVKDASAYPPDHWYEILEKDPRMSWTGTEIRYADWVSPLDTIFKDSLTPANQTLSSQKHLSKEQKKLVYRFKAFLWYRKSLWRRIEIQGAQTLGDLDNILRDAFEHDHFDHLSGFWKLEQRGQRNRYREVDLGNINPFEGGDASTILVANLKLKPGNRLKYVYDFGDWIEHRIELEAIVEPEKGAKYPRIVGQNKPRYHYCHTCKEGGKKVIATWICITCSNRRQENVFVCEACAEADHEEHYIDTILY